MIESIVKKFYEGGDYKDVGQLIDAISACSREDICQLIVHIEQKEVKTSNIPQYSSFDDGTINMIRFLRMSGNFGPSFVEVGQHYLENGHHERAYIKYGENHAKLSELLGTTNIKTEDRRRVYLNDLGYVLEKKTEEEQHECFIKLAGIIPIVQYSIINGIEDDRALEEVLCNYLSPSTALRRRRNTWYLISALRGDED